MPKNKKYPTIKYTSRDFNSIRSDLIDYAQKHYSNTFKDFSEAGFGSLMLDTTAYIGDILSFYLDYSVNESFLDTAIEYDNVLKLGRQMGYKFNPNPSSYGVATFYIIVPAPTTGTGPDTDYVPILKRGTQVSSIDGVGFTLNEEVNFANPNNEIVVAKVNETTGVPTFYAIKAKGQVVSGEIQSTQFNLGKFQKFLKLRLNVDNVTEVVSVFDGEGHEYFEVDYLSQDVVYRSTKNRGTDNKTVQSTLRPFVVPRRFTIERTRTELFLQFGFGTEIEDTSVDPAVDPSRVVLDVHGKNYTSDTSFDPTNFLKTDKLGVAPSDTTLTVSYRVNDAKNTNVGADSIINVDAPFFEFADSSILNNAKLNNVINSLEVTNEESITGDVTLPNSEELKKRIYNVFSSQNRAVTLQDYKSLCYSMPPQFGAIKRVNIVRDPDSFRRNLNLYVISEDEDGNLVKTSQAIKDNLKLWLNQSRMINDTIDILDAKIVNIGFEFTAISSLNANKFDVLSDAITQLVSYYNQKFEIGDPFYVTDIYNQVNKMDGIIDVSRVKVIRKDGEAYSSLWFDMDDNFSEDGRYIRVPNNVIFEIKYPDVDIKGSIE